MPRILYILHGLVPPKADPRRDPFHFLSEVAEGEVLLPVWWRSLDKIDEFAKASFPTYRVGNFRYHFLLSYRYPAAIRKVATFFFYLRNGLRLNREKRFDVIVTYGTNTPGVAGMVLKYLTGAKLIPEIPGVPENIYKYDAPNPGALVAVKRFLADLVFKMVCLAADCIVLRYPTQLDKYPRLRHKKTKVIHGFVPVRTIPSDGTAEKFLLLVGFPWYTKGVDIVIRAFKSIAAEFPDYTLKLLGHYPDRRPLEELAAGCSQIEFLRPGDFGLVVKMLTSCSVFVLASRTESQGRVLLEAMAARKPLIASAVGGIPYYITDNDNGLLFASENVSELADKMRVMLSSPELRSRIAERGYSRVFSEFDERAFVRSFREMLEGLTPEAHRPGAAALEKPACSKTEAGRG